MKCDFEGPHLCGFQQSGSDDFDWVWYSKSVPDNATTGPNADHTTEEGLSLSVHTHHTHSHTPPPYTHTHVHTHTTCTNAHTFCYVIKLILVLSVGSKMTSVGLEKRSII